MWEEVCKRNWSHSSQQPHTLHPLNSGKERAPDQAHPRHLQLQPSCQTGKEMSEVGGKWQQAKYTLCAVSVRKGCWFPGKCKPCYGNAHSQDSKRCIPNYWPAWPLSPQALFLGTMVTWPLRFVEDWTKSTSRVDSKPHWIRLSFKRIKSGWHSVIPPGWIALLHNRRSKQKRS